MDNKPKKISIRDIGPGRIALLAVAGIILLATSIPWKNSGKDTGGSLQEASGTQEKNEGNEAYIRQLENKLKQILEKVDGVGQVEVMITLKASGEAILNKDYTQEDVSEEETGNQNSKITNSQKKEEETVLADENGTGSPYVIKQLEPEISGVLIICEGAGSNQVAASVMQAAQAVFGISSSHIKILKMEERQ